MMRGWEDCTAGKIRPASESCENAGEVFARMWITIHGAACMTLAGDYDLTEEETANMLEDICRLYCK